MVKHLNLTVLLVDQPSELLCSLGGEEGAPSSSIEVLGDGDALKYVPRVLVQSFQLGGWVGEGPKIK